MVKLRANQANRMANGLILLIFGFLLLLIQLRITNHWIWLTYVKQPPTFFFVAGIVSLWLKHEKAFGYILTGIGVIGYLDILFRWSAGFTEYTFPIIVMMSGIGLIVFARR